MGLGQVLIGLFSVVAGVNALSKGAKHLSEGLRDTGGAARGKRIGGSNIPAVIVPRAATKRMPPIVSKGQKVATKVGQASMTLREVRSLGDRLSIIIDKVNEGSTDPVIVAWARKEVSQRRPGSTAWNGEQWVVPEKFTRGEIAAIHKGLRRSARYTSDPQKTDLYASARKALATGAFDCDEYSIVGGSALKAIGIPVALEVIQTKDSDSPNHIFILANSEKTGDGEWIPVDASVNMGVGWRAPDSMVARRWIYETE